MVSPSNPRQILKVAGAVVLAMIHFAYPHAFVVLSSKQETLLPKL